MAYRSLLTVLTDLPAESDALAYAQAMASQTGAHLGVHCLGIDPTRYEALPAGSAMIFDAGRDEAAAHARKLAEQAGTVVGADSAHVAVEQTVLAQPALDRHIARIGRYCDLAITGRPYGDAHSPIAAIIFEALLFGANAPVLVTPDAAPRAFDHITVAWNDSEEALSAIRKSLPLLVAAQHVDLVMVDPPARSPERSDPGGALALMLARHGVKCEVSILSKTLPRVSDVLLRFATDRQSDLIVMGAYGHSRFREALIGGATRDILEEAEIPVFMAH